MTDSDHKRYAHWRIAEVKQQVREPVASRGELVTPNHNNELVLCPNCHTLFDDGSLYVDPNDGVTLRHWNHDPRYEGVRIRFVEGHKLDKERLRRVHDLHWNSCR